VPRLSGTQDPLFLNSFEKGEEAAFDCLFREYYPALSYFAGRLVTEIKTAEDIVQDCFVRLWQRRGQFSTISSIKSYLYTMVRNDCLKHLGRQKRSGVFPLNPATEPCVETSLIAADTLRELYQLIESLSPRLQQIIRLYYLEGKTNQEIAQELDISPDTVIRQRLRAVLALRKRKISL
jgi:RNA polymerase sigma-70 factor (ECF subfamily)